MLRKFLFWSHLVAGVIAGIVVFIMSATGVILTYEKQLEAWDLAQHKVPEFAENKKAITTDQVLNIARQKHPDEHHFYIQWHREPGQAIPVWAGQQRYLISPESGDIIQVGQSTLVHGLHVVTDLHRWLAFEGEKLNIGKNVTAYSNLILLFLLISGAYLWFPRQLKWRVVSNNIRFKKQYKSRHAKHFNWHHVIGFWSLIPLVVIVSTATIFHFTWANKALYAVNGEQLPIRPKKPELNILIDGEQSYQALFERAKLHAEEHGAPDWYSMWLEIGSEANTIRFYIDRSLGNRPSVAYSLYLDTNTGQVMRTKFHRDWSDGDRAWDAARYLHTGEYFGVVGQTIAGLASLAACFLVYTGFTLAWRRLITPNFKTKKPPHKKC